MNTIQYIKTLKTKTKQPVFVAFRQVLCHHLYSNGVSPRIICKLLGYSEMSVYKSIYRARDLLHVNDEIIKQAYDELNNHKIAVIPCMVNEGVLSKFAGYKMIIDNIIY